jgi:hypothetical protein
MHTWLAHSMLERQLYFIINHDVELESVLAFATHCAAEQGAASLPICGAAYTWPSCAMPYTQCTNLNNLTWLTWYDIDHCN